MYNTSRYHAGLIIDVKSSRLTPKLRTVLRKKLSAVSAVHRRKDLVRVPYAVSTWDEFQTVAISPIVVPDLIFDLRRRFQPLKIWIGVGIGEIAGPVRAPANRIGGKAMESARKALEEVKSGKNHKYTAWTRFHTPNEEFDTRINLIYTLHDALLEGVSRKQWRTIDAYVETNQVQEAAEKLELDKSTVSRNLKRAHYWEFEETAHLAKKIIEGYFH